MRKETLAWTLVLLAVLGWFLFSISSILLPFVVGFVLAYMLAPLVGRLHGWGVPRGLAAMLPIGVAVGLLVGGMVVGVPLLVEQVSSFVQRLPVYLMTLQHFVLPDYLDRVLGGLQKKLQLDALLRPLTAMGAEGLSFGLVALQRGLAGAAAAFNLLLLAVMTPLVAYYLLADWPTVTKQTLTQLPTKWRPVVKTCLTEIDIKLSAYLRGVMTVCLLLGIFYATALEMIGLELGWVIGLVTGLLGFLPIVGGSIGLLLMFGVALVQYQLQAWEPYALIAAAYAAGQVLEGYVLTPYLVGRKVGLHPLWVIFALLAGGTLGGILGMLLALPVAVMVSVVLPRVLDAWRASVK